ncbi:hypothetical protein DPMN_087695 [Dreissena polymorpha]|uniref:Uncharacterized protein n=1 Tax=Dreissena polymorpha TaxID=45954 RepID=A0A9D4QX55_DREPO|nr:hypothetical protein DPMN_087695 [Dreissena polymorpha]
MYTCIWEKKRCVSLATCLVSRAIADRRGPVFESRDIGRLYSASQASAIPAGATSLRNHLAKARSSAAEAARSGPAAYTPGHGGETTGLHSAVRTGQNWSFTRRSVGHDFRAFDTKSLDVSYLLGAVFQPKPGGDQSNV